MSALVSLRDDVSATAARELPPGAAVSIHPSMLAVAADKAGQGETGAGPAASKPTDAEKFSTRIQLLIERAGGVEALAEHGGVTVHAVYDWRDGHIDMSRAHCLRLVRALRVSPLWLIGGEGGMTDGAVEQASPDDEAPQERQPEIDAERLAAALQVLQSYIVLAGGSLSVEQRAEAVAELYGLLSRPGPADAGRLIAFHRMLAAHLRGHRP